ncbi:MAG: hypothetical protein ABJQ69_03415 [Ekhidna sp.]
MIWTACRSDNVSQKAIYLTKGDLGFHRLETEKSAEAIVVGNEQLKEMAEDSQTNQGLNIN